MTGVQTCALPISAFDVGTVFVAAEGVAKVITCRLQDGQEPPWSFGAADTKITDGGYAVMKHAVFRVKGIPVFYSPYMILPAKHERQTGFLFPAWYMSDRDGFGLETPFFVNLSPTADITLYPRYFSKRGVMMERRNPRVSPGIPD